ncbi:hypothetical protein GIB67_034945 [Kingdonia uniflora]|uniref:GPI transamidase component PIG-S n=1 Tax=Kingdonia uniflora TaxID=39325 RepID=A0A7J7NHA5_9MAGN|nr:hypothetical protein GIB67_034945 [Kingdonia uniflora]
MAETPTSQTPNLITKSFNEEDPVTEFDSNTMRRSKPGIKRLLLVLTVLSSFILALPFLLKSIEIYRSPLPFDAIDSLSKDVKSNPLYFPCRFRTMFVGFDEFSVKRLEFEILESMGKLRGYDVVNDGCGCGSSSEVSVTIEFDVNEFAGGSGGDDDNVMDERLHLVLRDGDESESLTGGKVYTVVVVKKDDEVETRVVVGKYRHAWVVGNVLEYDAVTIISDVFVKFFMKAGRKEEGLVHQGQFLPVGADGSVVLSFSLLNANPQDWIYDWDFKRIDEVLLAPVVDALAPIANISVESQVLYHTPKSSFSPWDENLQSYVFSTKDLPFFVNSNEWHLDTSIAAGGRSKVLQFVVYVPSSEEWPLLLQLPNGEISKTNGFISPMWGGVIVWNPPSSLKSLRDKNPVRHMFSPQDLQEIFEVFMGQLRQLLGLNSDYTYVAESHTYKFLASEKGFTEWELDVLSRHHTCSNLISCATTLGSLSTLVLSLPRMIIMDEIGKQVKFSLEAASLAQSNASLGLYDASAGSSRQARALAEDAFFHPSIMSISYYSFEHCFAIYSFSYTQFMASGQPFFLPVSMHIIVAAARELRRYKKEKAKYLAWPVMEKKSN